MNPLQKIFGMGGWKTYTGLIIIGLSAITSSLGLVEATKALQAIGAFLATIGIAHKIEKVGPK